MSLTATLLGLGIAGAVASTAGAVGSAVTQSTANKRAYKWGKKYHQDVTEPFYRQQLADELRYSDPAFHMGRIRSAGLNPHLLASSSLQNVNVPSMSVQGMPSDQVGDGGFASLGKGVSSSLTNILSLRQMGANVELTEANARKASADARISEQLADGNYGGVKVDNISASTSVLNAQPAEIAARISNLDSQTLLNGARQSFLSAQTSHEFVKMGLTSAQTEQVYSNIELIVSNIDLNSYRRALLIAQEKVQNGLLSVQQAQISSLYAAAKNSEAQALLADATRGVTEQTGSGPNAGGIPGVALRFVLNEISKGVGRLFGNPANGLTSGY